MLFASKLMFWQSYLKCLEPRKGKRKKKINTLPIFTDWICVGILLQFLGSLPATLPSFYLHFVWRLKASCEWNLRVFLRPFLNAQPALCMNVAFLIPQYTWELLKDPVPIYISFSHYFPRLPGLSVAVPSVAPCLRLMQLIPVPLNAFSKSVCTLGIFWVGWNKGKHILCVCLSGSCQAFEAHDHSFSETKVPAAPCGNSIPHHEWRLLSSWPFCLGCGACSLNNAFYHKTVAASSPGPPMVVYFWLDCRLLQKFILIVFFASRFIFGGRPEPWSCPFCHFLVMLLPRFFFKGRSLKTL